jgi:thioesterase domain-containing protein/acyl carrier protein
VLAEVDQLTLRRIDGALRIPELKQDLPSATEAASAPDANRTKPNSPAEIALHHNVTQGIDASSGVQALATVLGAKSPPSTLIVSSMDLNALIRQADSISAAATATNETRFSRPQLDSEFEAPRDDVERSLAEIWGKLLGVEGVGIRDSFFDLGGHSLIAVRLFNEIADRFKVDLPMSVLLQSPTIASLADIVRAEAGVELASSNGDASSVAEGNAKQALQYRFVVPMHAGTVADRTPIFLVAGMFGNVLNLSHMAHLLGEERPFYALQARGLYGDSQPHESFEEAAKDYIEEIRKIQPEGPYLLGGFSGGGITAYEMARQLLAQGEKVLQVIMLDTPLARISRFSRRDRLEMLWQDFKRHGKPLEFIRNRVKARNEWQRKQRLKQQNGASQAETDQRQFKSQRIGDAFMRSVARYETKPVGVSLALFRPKLNVQYVLSDGRRVDGERNYVSEDNGWTPLVSELRVFEVPGNHDSMVLEPNVRVLVSLLKKAIAHAGATRVSEQPH